jgi:hypothetical protein
MTPFSLLKRFLREQGVYERLNANRYLQDPRGVVFPSKREIYSKEEPKDYLVSLIDFSKCIEGFDYWNKINEKWLDILIGEGYV